MQCLSEHVGLSKKPPYLTTNLRAVMAVASFTVSDLRQFAGGISWSSLAMPTVVLIVLAMLVLPMPPIMLDIFFTFNILLALLIIMVGLNSSQPLDFSAFPPIILWSTMLRLG